MGRLDEKFIATIRDSRSVTVVPVFDVDCILTVFHNDVWKPSSESEVTTPVRRLQAILLLDIKVYVSRMIKCLTLSPWVKTVTITRGVTTQLSPFSPTQTDFIAFQNPTFEHPLNWLHLRINLSWKAQTGPQEQTHRSRLNQIFALRWNKNPNFSRLR